MLRFIANLFPIRTESMNVFVAFVLREGCASVKVAPIVNELGQPGLPGVGMFELFSPEVDDIATEYCVQCTAVAPRGKRMVYRHMCVARYIPCREHVVDHEQYVSKIYSEAKRCVTLLNQEEGFNAVRVELFGTSGILVMQ